MKYILILEDDGDLAAGMEMALMGDDFVFTVCGSIKEAEERAKAKKGCANRLLTCSY